MAAWRAGPCAMIQSNMIKFFEGECGEEMKSNHTWDLGTEGEQQQLLIPTAGVTAAYAEQAHKVTLNASSDIFARCSTSKPQTLATKSKFLVLTISMLWLSQAIRQDKCVVFFPLLASTAGPLQLGQRDTGSFPLMCQMLEAFPLSKR
jgi:hypothetical protein